MTLPQSHLTGLACHVPPHMLEGLLRYIEHGIAPGSFLMAVLQNDLKEACVRADEVNLRSLPAYVTALYNYAPEACWGSPQKVNEWMAVRAQEGL